MKKIVSLILITIIMISLTGCASAPVQDQRTRLEKIIDGFQPLFDMINADDLDYLYTLDNSDEATNFEDFNDFGRPAEDKGVFNVWSTYLPDEIVESPVSLRRYEYYNRNTATLSGTFFSENEKSGVDYAPMISEENGEIVIHNGKTYEDEFYFTTEVPEEILEKYNNYIPLYDIISIDEEYLNSMTADDYNYDEPGFNLKYTIGVDDRNVQKILEIYPEIDASRITLIQLRLTGEGAAAGSIHSLEVAYSLYTETGGTILSTGIQFVSEKNAGMYFPKGDE